MKRNNAYVFGWDEEPADERPSEFASSSGYSALSGYHQPSDLTRRVAHRQAPSGFGRAALAFVGILSAAGGALYLLAKLLHG